MSIRTSSPSVPQAAPKKSLLARLALQGALIAAGLGACGAIVIGLGIAITWPNLPELHAMTDYRPHVPLRIYTADKVLIGEFGTERRNVLRFDEFPDSLKHAVLSAEDDNFYQHSGVDWMGVVRATLTNAVSLSKSQGASTITMQEARNFYLSANKTFLRKFYELLLTYKIESQLTKDQILELYMNQIYLGHRAYGFSAASRVYLGKPLSEITPAEAALLAGIPKAPSRFNPIANLERATLRQHYVLGRMHQLGFLDDAAYRAALAQPLTIGQGDADEMRASAVHGEYPAELARQLMVEIFSDEAYTKGIDVYTTIDAASQQSAYRAIRTSVLDYTRRAPYPGPEDQIDLPQGVENDPAALDTLIAEAQEKTPDAGDLLTGVVLAASPGKITVARNAKETVDITDKKALAIVQRSFGPNVPDNVRLRRGSVVFLHKNNDQWEIVNFPVSQAALISLSPEDGAIRAMIGGFDSSRGDFNRATQAWRQPGSNIKPFIYSAALERGLTPATQISDQPFAMTAEQTGSRPWSPKNDGDKYEPMLTLRNALYRSKNMVSIRILQAITPQYGQEYLTRFGFEKARWPAVLPLALGAGGATPLQVVDAYAVFANGGYRVTPFLIDKVTDRDGKVLMRFKPSVAGTDAPRAIDPRTAWLMDDILRGVARQGTAARAGATLKRSDLAGKTGTTNDAVDVWFSGYTPALATTVWMGFDQPRSLGSNVYGSGLALNAWLDYMQSALKDVPVAKQRDRPEGLIVDNGEYFLSEYPPGQAVASLDLPTKNSLDDFLNNAVSGDRASSMMPTPGSTPRDSASPLAIPVPEFR